jgi:hypothetical protein
MRYGAISGVALLLVANGQDAFALPPGVAAEVVDLQGIGERRPALNASWVPARAEDDLSAGAFVRTGPASKMALAFADETQVRLNQNSLLQVKSVAGSAYPADGIAAAFVKRIESLQSAPTAESTVATALDKL